MKKVTLWLLALVVMIVGAFSLAACGEELDTGKSGEGSYTEEDDTGKSGEGNYTEESEDKEISYVGVYKFYSATNKEDGTVYKVGDIDADGTTLLTEDIVVIELKEDGSGILTRGASTGTVTWKINEEDAGKVDLMSGGDTLTIECDGKEIHVVIEKFLDTTLKKK